jgi:hypothetical protein
MMNAGVKMNILRILINTQFTPFAEFDYETYGGASEHAKIGEYRDMVVVIDGTSKDPSSIEVFDESGECIYSGYVTKDGLGIRQYDARGLRS